MGSVCHCLNFVSWEHLSILKIRSSSDTTVSLHGSVPVWLQWTADCQSFKLEILKHWSICHKNCCKPFPDWRAVEGRQGVVTEVLSSAVMEITFVSSLNLSCHLNLLSLCWRWWCFLASWQSVVCWIPFAYELQRCRKGLLIFFKPALWDVKPSVKMTVCVQARKNIHQAGKKESLSVDYWICQSGA